MEKNYENLLNNLAERQESCWLDVQGVIIRMAEENNHEFYAWLESQGTIIEASLDLNDNNPVTFKMIPECYKEEGWDSYTYERYADAWMENRQGSVRKALPFQNIKEKEGETMENKDPWLYSGCVCELFGNENRVVAIYDHYDSKCDRLLFKNNQEWYEISIDQPKGTHYHPISTPWDYAPNDAIEIIIDSYGIFKFRLNDGRIWFDDIAPCWNLCPDHLKGHTWERPAWAKVR